MSNHSSSPQGQKSLRSKVPGWRQTAASLRSAHLLLDRSSLNGTIWFPGRPLHAVPGNRSFLQPSGEFGLDLWILIIVSLSSANERLQQSLWFHVQEGSAVLLILLHYWNSWNWLFWFLCSQTSLLHLLFHWCLIHVFRHCLCFPAV